MPHSHVVSSWYISCWNPAVEWRASWIRRNQGRDCELKPRARRSQLLSSSRTMACPQFYHLENLHAKWVDSASLCVYELIHVYTLWQSTQRSILDSQTSPQNYWIVPWKALIRSTPSWSYEACDGFVLGESYCSYIIVVINIDSRFLYKTVWYVHIKHDTEMFSLSHCVEI